MTAKTAKQPLPLEVLDVIARRFAALADVNRLRILQALQHKRETTVSQLAETLDISQPNVSSHLTVLRAAGFVTCRRVGKNAFYSLADPRVTNLCEIVCASVRDEQKRLAEVLAGTSIREGTVSGVIAVSKTDK
jgi:DNA-binding transcriptional ArsR family regulator